MDAITLTAITRELNETVANGRVQAVVQPDEHSLTLEVFGRGGRQWLLFDAQPAVSRVHLLPEKARRGLETDAPFFLLARKRLLGARLVDVFQPAWERVLYCGCEHPELGKTTLAAEIMGKWSNLLLLAEDGVILEALRRFGPDRNPQRPILPGRPYLPPPPQSNRIPIDLLTLVDLELLFDGASAGPIWRALVAQMAGISPLVARELVFRATGDAQAAFSHANARPQTLFDAVVWLRDLPRQGGWAPSLVFDATSGEPVAFAPYELSHLGQYELLPSVSRAASAYYAALVGADAYAGRRKRVQSLLDDARRRLNGRRISLGEQAAGEEEVDEARGFGEWILAYAWQIRPGDAELLADTGDGLLRIPLDPTLSASENAQAYFARYHKVKRAAGRIPGLLAEVDRDLQYIDQLQIDLGLADNAAQIEELREALLASGLAPAAEKRRRPTIQRSQPFRLRTADGFTVIIGRNAVQNERVTWELAGPDDLWLHTERVPGSHVVIKTEGREVPEGTLRQAAAWAAYQSQARHDGKVSVIHTQRRHLRRIPGGRPGQVRVLQAQSLLVAPLAPD